MPSGSEAIITHSVCLVLAAEALILFDWTSVSLSVCDLFIQALFRFDFVATFEAVYSTLLCLVHPSE